MTTYRAKHAALVKQIEKTATWSQDPGHEAVHLLNEVNHLTYAGMVPSKYVVQLIVNLHAMTEAFLAHYELWDEET